MKGYKLLLAAFIASISTSSLQADSNISTTSTWKHEQTGCMELVIDREIIDAECVDVFVFHDIDENSHSGSFENTNSSTIHKNGRIKHGLIIIRDPNEIKKRKIKHLRKQHARLNFN